jgi:nucleoside-diphosphate-sugar epimerase
MQPTEDKVLPEFIEDEDTLNEVMTRPSPELVEFMKDLPDPLLVLGSGGKMGPTLAVLAKRAAQAAGNRLRVIAVSRYSDPQAKSWLEAQGVETLAFDLLERDRYGSLPEAENVIYLVGLKFGTTQNPGSTWIMNTLVPAYVSERYRDSRIVALSTGNVYPLVSVESGGSKESDPMEPVGEYSSACMARERIFDYYASKNGTPLVLVRLNYALDLRYGVLVDIAQKVYEGRQVDVTTGYFNCIWQGDANDMILRSLAFAGSPPRILNLTSTQPYSIRWLAGQFAARVGVPALVQGSESDSAYISNTSLMRELLGDPPTPIEKVIDWTARWIERGGRTLNKPTHFEVRDGKY